MEICRHEGSGDMGDSWWQPYGCHRPSPTILKHTESGAYTGTWGHHVAMGITPLGRDLVTQVALLYAMWDSITPGCWRHFTPCIGTARSCLSSLMPPYPQGWYHTHQNMALSHYSPGPRCRGKHVGAGSVGMGWVQCGTGT